MASMMGSSKYEFEPEQLDKDIKNKREIAQAFRMDLIQVLNKIYRYSDNVPMSDKAKREVLLKVHQEFIGDD